ncbi:MAG: hypothetical protein ACREJB_18715 [Planctomycetaceae bacterium]
MKKVFALLMVLVCCVFTLGCPADDAADPVDDGTETETETGAE